MKINKYVCDSCKKEENETVIPKGWRQLAIESETREYSATRVIGTIVHICPDCDFKREITVFKKEN